MTFGTLLRELLSRCDIKMYILADALGYDKSYISKWINSAKLPPSKDIDALADKIAAFFARSCSNEQLEMLSQSYGLEGDIKSALSVLLKKTYNEEKYSAEPRAPRTRAVTPTARRGTVRECVIATQPVEYPMLLDDQLSLALGSGKSRLTAIIDEEGFSQDVDCYWRYISYLMSLGQNVDISLVEMPKSRRIELPERLLIAKDAFVYRTVELPFSHDTIAIRTDDPEVVDAYYKDVRRFLMRSQPMVESSNSNNNLYYYKYAGSDTRHYLLSSMFPLYMSEKLFFEILGKYGSSIQKSEKARSRYLREFTTPKSVIIFDSAFLRYMSTGKISAFDAFEHETLTKSERKKHLLELIEQIEEGNLILRVLNDKNPVLNYDETTLSFFMNNSSAYFTNLKRRKDGVQYFVSSENRKRLREFFSHIEELGDEYLTTKKFTIDYIYNGIKNI